MKQSFVFLSVATVLVANVTSLQSFDYFKERYQRMMLGNVLYQVLQDKVAAGQCSMLKEKANRQAIADEILASNDYAVPFWVAMFKRVSPYESLFSYAHNVYRVVLQVLDDVENNLKVNFSTIKATSSELREFMRFIVDRGDAGLYPDSDEFEKQIASNVENAKLILTRYQADIKASQENDERKKPVLSAIDRGLNLINNAARRLTWLERKHREMQMKRFDDYISRYCK